MGGVIFGYLLGANRMERGTRTRELRFYVSKASLLGRESQSLREMMCRICWEEKVS